MEKAKSEERIGSNFYHQKKIEINCVIFCFENRTLKILLTKNEESFENVNWKLPNAVLAEGTMLNTAQTILKNYFSSEDFFLDQLKAFSSDSLSNSEDISIGYYAMVKQEKITEDDEELSSDMIWIDVNHVITHLNEKDRRIIDFSIKELRKNILCSAIGFNLLPEKFTLLQVFHLYEGILGVEINKGNFRRKILQRGLVSSLNEKEEKVSYRAAQFYSLSVPKDSVWNLKFNFSF